MELQPERRRPRAAGHSINDGAAEALALINDLAGDDATVVRRLIDLGVADEDSLTNPLFYRHHPDPETRKLDAHNAATSHCARNGCASATSSCARRWRARHPPDHRNRQPAA